MPKSVRLNIPEALFLASQIILKLRSHGGAVHLAWKLAPRELARTMWSPISTLNSLARALPSRRLVKNRAVYIYFFGCFLRSGVPQNLPKLDDFSLTTHSFGDPLFQADRNVHAFHFHPDCEILMLETSPETCRLKSWKVETKNPEQVLGKTIAWFPSFTFNRFQLLKKECTDLGHETGRAPSLGSLFFFFEDRVRRFLQEVGGISDNMGMAFEEASSFELRDLKRTWYHWISWKSNSYC